MHRCTLGLRSSITEPGHVHYTAPRAAAATASSLIACGELFAGHAQGTTLHTPQPQFKHQVHQVRAPSLHLSPRPQCTS